MNDPMPFKGTADEAPNPPWWFRDEDGIEWAGPHGADEACPWGGCEQNDYRPGSFVPNGWAPDESATGAPGSERPWCHTVEGDTQDWSDFVDDRTFVKEIQ